MKIETRAVSADLKIEKREDGKRTARGYAALYNTESVDLGGFTERIAQGAFSRTLQASDARALLNHNRDIVLGRQSAGTLRLSEDSRGLAFALDLPDTQAGRDLGVSIERGDIREMSFSFVTEADNWAKVAGKWLRTLLDVDLLDVSPVAFAAYPQTEIGMRAAIENTHEASEGLARAKAEEEARARKLRLYDRA